MQQVSLSQIDICEPHAKFRIGEASVRVGLIREVFARQRRPRRDARGRELASAKVICRKTRSNARSQTRLNCRRGEREVARFL